MTPTITVTKPLALNVRMETGRTSTKNLNTGELVRHEQTKHESYFISLQTKFVNGVTVKKLTMIESVSGWVCSTITIPA